MSVYNNGLYQTPVTSLIADTNTLSEEVDTLRTNIGLLGSSLANMGTYASADDSAQVVDNESTVIKTIELQAGNYLLNIFGVLDVGTGASALGSNFLTLESGGLLYGFVGASFSDLQDITSCSITGTIPFRLSTPNSIQLKLLCQGYIPDTGQYTYTYDYQISELSSPSEYNLL